MSEFHLTQGAQMTEREEGFRDGVDAAIETCRWMLDQLDSNAPGRSHIVVVISKLRALTPPTDRAESVIPAPTEQQIDAAMQGYEWPEAWDDAKVREVCREVWHLMHGAK